MTAVNVLLTDAARSDVVAQGELVGCGRGRGPPDLLLSPVEGAYCPTTFSPTDFTLSELPPTITRKRPGSTTRFLSGP